MLVYRSNADRAARLFVDNADPTTLTFAMTLLLMWSFTPSGSRGSTCMYGACTQHQRRLR
jgi:hypothetical protein